MTGKIKKVLQGFAVLALAAIFIALGLWQLDRARDLSTAQNAPVVQDQRIYQLSDLTSPEGALPVSAYGKAVELTGYYIANYIAPNQKEVTGKVGDWEVALMQVDSGSAILVVRGLWEDRLKSPEIVMSTKVSITGTLEPSQFEDRAAPTPSQLSRLDSSILTSEISDYQLYDGFIAATSESTRDGAIERTRVAGALPQGKVPGYYWQHISYVAIWWLMAALVLWAPFYKRRDETSDPDQLAS
jgi:cytochrome oxidase assembly protein ShyY1